jgi:hypothetical protein
MHMTKQMHQHQTAHGHVRKRDVMLNNFLGGLAWGLGTVIGATVVVAILLSVLTHTPVIGNYIQNITNNFKQSAK